MKIDPKWDSSEEILSLFITNNRERGGVPKTDYNWSSDNSDISFVWRYNFMALHHLWMVTKGDRALPWLIDAVEWVLSMADDAIPGDAQANVIVDWNPKRQQLMSLPQMGYARSPHKEMGPGWSRFIDIGGGKKAFRPEILASGTIGLALAEFIRDAGDSIPAEKRKHWLDHLARLFEWHAPNWRDSQKHTDGESFGKPHSGLDVAAYFWPAGIGEEVHATIPGLNQQTQFLTMGVLVEEMIGRDIDAKRKMKLFCEKTLPHLIKEENGRMFTAYDLRAHSKMSPYNAEPTNDANHWNKSAVLFIEAARLGFIPEDYQDKLIKTILEVTHLGGGRMAILQDGSCEHAGGNHKSNPGIEHIVGALGFKNGHKLLELAEMALCVDTPRPGGHKSMAYHAMFQRAKAQHEGKTCPAIPKATPSNEVEKIHKPEKKQDKKTAKRMPVEPPKQQATKKPQTNTPQPGSENTVITPPMEFAMGGKPQAIPESRGSKGAHIKSMGNKHVVNNPGNWDAEKKQDAIMLNPIAKGESTVVWYIGAQRYETRVVVK